MITVTLRRGPDGMIREFSAAGHSGFADPGTDIICAAVSAIATTVIGSLQDLAGLKPVYRLEEGLIECRLPDPEDMNAGQSGTARTLMDTMAVGCRQIQDSYGKRYVRIIEKSFI
ncbi:MAG TPA: ribosomal-processing cysteine protease Prp [Clostridiales bacterium]|nr:ribosomal-processing cysteine protease Prp [Clostridiales bacterium]